VRPYIYCMRLVSDREVVVEVVSPDPGYAATAILLVQVGSLSLNN
jgi:hypothetical protein